MIDRIVLAMLAVGFAGLLGLAVVGAISAFLMFVHQRDWPAVILMALFMWCGLAVALWIVGQVF